jgi:hypothetical protein
VGLSIRIPGNWDTGVLAMLRWAWNEENFGGHHRRPCFEVTFFEWWRPGRETRTFFLVEIDDFAVGMANVKRWHLRRRPRPGTEALPPLGPRAGSGASCQDWGGDVETQYGPSDTSTPMPGAAGL